MLGNGDIRFGDARRAVFGSDFGGLVDSPSTVTASSDAGTGSGTTGTVAAPQQGSGQAPGASLGGVTSGVGNAGVNPDSGFANIFGTVKADAKKAESYALSKTGLVFNLIGIVILGWVLWKLAKHGGE